MDTEPPSLIFYSIPLFLLFSTITIGGAIVTLMLLLFCSAMISASEIAFFSLSPQDIEELKKDNNRANKRVLALKKSPRFLLATILIANNFINIAIVLLSEFALRKTISEAHFDRWALHLSDALHQSIFTMDQLSRFISFLITVIGVTFLLVLFGEVAPKVYANVNNIKHARVMSWPLIFLSRLLSPFNNLLVHFSNNIEERVYRQRLSVQSTPDKKEIGKAIDLAVSEEYEKEDVDILKGIIHFGDVVAKQVMKSRMDITALEIEANYNEVMNVIRESGYSRIPVYETDFDSIKGILYVKDLLGYTLEGVDFEWQKLVRENVLYIPESKKIDELLKEFQLKRTHMAIVVDEYGGTSGLITLEDIMEEVIGDIRDEFDQQDEVEYLKIDDHNYIFDGKTLLNDVARITGLEAEIFVEGRGTADSIAGLVLELEGQIPKVDKVISYNDLKFKIVSVTTRRIEKINITI